MAILPYPHARHDCERCRETDADLEITSGMNDCPQRYCSWCAGLVLARHALSRPNPGEPVTLTYVFLPPDGGSWE